MFNKRMFNKRMIFLCILLIGVLLISGCVDGQVDIKINGDGSGELSYAMVIDKRTYDPELFKGYIEKLEENLFTVEQKDMGEIILVKASVYLPRFRTIFDPTVVLGNEEGRIPVTFKKGWFFTRYEFDIDYDIEQAKDYLLKNLDLQELNFGKMDFSVRSSSASGENNADEIIKNEDMYKWNINKSGITKIHFETKTMNTINWIVSIGIPLFALIALFNERRKRKKD